MKFGIDMGHNCPPKDIGASGFKQEDNLTKAVGELLIKKLEYAGHKTVDCTPSKARDVNSSLYQRATKANAYQVDQLISIHFNAFNGKAYGSEVFAISSESKKIAQSVLSQIVKLGFTNRGVKDKAFYVLRQTRMSAILIECCFIDSKRDMDLFDAEKMAQAIFVGLVGQQKETLPPPKVVEESRILRITQQTLLKSTTQQSFDLEDENLLSIEPGDYPVLDSGSEEGHIWFEWDKQEFGDRNSHFVWEGHAKLV